LLLSWPISRLELVLGHFIAACLSLILLTFLALLPFVILIILGVGSLKLLFCAFLGFTLLIASFVAVGLMVSSWTATPLASALATLGILALFLSMGWAAPYLSHSIAYVIMGLAFGPRLSHFAIGLLDLNDIVYFLVLTIISLYLARPAGR
jgi:ABC-2 type transport system permease protein